MIVSTKAAKYCCHLNGLIMLQKRSQWSKPFWGSTPPDPPRGYAMAHIPLAAYPSCQVHLFSSGVKGPPSASSSPAATRDSSHRAIKYFYNLCTRCESGHPEVHDTKSLSHGRFCCCSFVHLRNNGASPSEISPWLDHY